MLALAQYGGKILLAIVVFIIGRFAIWRVTHFVGSQMNRSKIDTDVQPFLLSWVGVALNIMLLLSCAGIFVYRYSDQA